MANNNIRFLAFNGASALQPKDSKGRGAGCNAIPALATAPAADEGLRLIQAFLRIRDPRERQALLDRAERAARNSGKAKRTPNSVDN